MADFDWLKDIEPIGELSWGTASWFRNVRISV